MGIVVALALIFIAYCAFEQNHNAKIDVAVAKQNDYEKQRRAREHKNMKCGDFCIDKFWEDKAIKDQIEKRMGEGGYYDGHLIGTILNIEKAGVEKLLADCEEAVEYYSHGGDVINFWGEDCTNEQVTRFFQECVQLCKNQLKSFENGGNDNEVA